MIPAQGTDVPLDFPRNRIVREDANGTGGPGGGGMDNLERRVTTLEGDVKLIRTDLTTLTVRSENFATKTDISDLRTEMAQSRGEIKTDMATLRGELKAAMFESQQAILKEMEIKFEKLADKTRWKWSAVFIPLGVGVAGVIATLLTSYLTS